MSCQQTRIETLVEVSLPATEEAKRYFALIAAEIQRKFGFTVAEAVTRIDQYWADQSFLTALDVDSLTAELPD